MESKGGGPGMLPDVRETGRKVAYRFLQTPHLFYNDTIHYAETFTWLAALRFARLSGDGELVSRLKERFEPLFQGEKQYLPLKNHVDFNMFGCLPLELYRMTGETRYRDLGMPYADTQWEPPPDFPLAAAGAEERRRLTAEGYSWQTRLWMDDMYMITAIQSQAWKVTGDRKYIDRAAHEMAYYLDRLQLPGGLFYHAPGAPFQWGRANGWMAAGMAELLKNLPEDNPNRPRIMRGYLLMMESLKACQGADGMWKQLLDHPDCWNETSCTAMFTYALLAGVKNRWLPPAGYSAAAETAWEGLKGYIDGAGDLGEVCTGTPTGDNREFYYRRPRVAGDYHGQAPVLWCVNECLGTGGD